jgi:hypothetical protein
MTTDDPSFEAERARANRPLADAPEPDPPEPPTRHSAVTRRRPSHRVLETVLLASAAALLAAVAWPIATQGLRGTDPPAPAPTEPIPTPTPAPAANGPTIQIALLLDTSGSMDGLIDQARSQLWRVVNALDSATFHGDVPRLEIAVYEYGNDRLASEGGFIRQVSPFSTELDLVSEALFGLTTSGGDEFAGKAIANAIGALQWREGDDVLRVLYIAGNEAFDQGPVDFRNAIADARSKGIVINTINCLGMGSTADVGWAEGAALGGGKFLRIDHNAVEQYIAAPQDDEIARIGQLINGTYVGYGHRGKDGLDNLARQDDNSEGAGKHSSVQRALSKGSSFYRNESWDLVDALDGKVVDLDGIDRGTLAPELQGLDADELEAHVEAKSKERRELQKRLGDLQVERESFVTAERARQAGEDGERLDDAIIGSIVEQATAVGFSLKKS